MSADILDPQQQDVRKREWQNVLSIFMMLAILITVIFTNNRFNAYLIGGTSMPLLKVTFQTPRLDQLGLGKTAMTAKFTKLSDEEKGAIALRSARRLEYLGFTTFYVVLCLITILSGPYVMFNTLRKYPPKKIPDFAARSYVKILRAWVKEYRTIIGVWAVALIAAFLAGFYSFLQESPDVDQLLQQTVTKEVSSGKVISLYQTFNALAMGVTIYLAAIAVCVMWHAHYRGYGQGSCVLNEPCRIETETIYLGEQLKELRLVLYLSTTVLILRILQLSAGMNWVLAWVIPQRGELYESVKALVNDMVLVRALYNTLLLAAIYLPTAAVLSRRITKLAEQENLGKTAADRQKWLDNHGLSFNFMDHVPNLIAILGPLLASPVNDLLSHIGH